MLQIKPTCHRHAYEYTYRRVTVLGQSEDRGGGDVTKTDYDIIVIRYEQFPVLITELPLAAFSHYP